MGGSSSYRDTPSPATARGRAADTSMNIEGIVTRVTLQLVVAYSFAAAAAAWLLMPHRDDDPFAYWVIIPVAVMASTGIAYLLARRGRARLGSAIALVACYLALVGYVVYTGLGLRSYSLALGCVLIAASSTLVGRSAGIAAAVVGVATVVGLFLAEKAGYVTDLAVVRAIPPINVVVVYGIAFAAVGTLSLAFSRAFGQALKATRDQEARFRHLIEAAPLGYVLHRDGRILLANRRAAKGVGQPSADAMVGLDVLTLLPGADPATTRTRLDAAMALPAGESLAPVEHVVPDLAGGSRRVSLLTLRTEMADGPALLTVIRDVTQERAAADALAEAKRSAEAANRAKSEFLATMSHEIRTPLNAVVGLSQLARGAGLDPARRADYLDKIESASQSLLELISDILDFSKIEAGALKLEATDFDPRAELARLVRLHGVLASDKGLVLATHVDPAVPAALRGDPVRLRQVVGNFLSNAIKFTERGGIDVRLLAPSAGRLRIEVEDSGIGIDEARAPSLFLPFTQADSSTTRRYGGTGLGLSVCGKIVDLMGGTLGARRRESGGSLFWAEVPLPEGRLPAPGASPSPSTKGLLAGARILLVEDNEINQIVAVAALEDLGIATTVVSGGEEALALLGRTGSAFDAVLMDLHMPGIDGLETTRRLRQRFPGGTLPVIALTAAAFDEDRQRCREAGMDDYLAKPFEFERLEAVLHRWIRPRPKAPGEPAGG